MRIEVVNNGATRDITGVQLWSDNGRPLIQIGVRQTYFYASVPLGTSLHRGSFCVQFYKSAMILRPNNTRVLLFPETDEEKTMCEDGELFQQVQRSCLSLTIVGVSEIGTETHKLLWSNNVS